jgi:hypothetical protein
MGPAYERYYKQRLAQLASSRRAASVSPFVPDVAEAVDRGIGDAGLPEPYRVRPDARLFLVINFEEFVVLPTSSVEGLATAYPLPRLVRDNIPRDVARIVEAALQQTGAAGDVEISGHDVMRAIATNWERLSFAQPWRWER